MSKVSQVAELLAEGKIGAIVEGIAEAGNRALGHRSILADPRLKKGKDLVNAIKIREPFRPFAGVVIDTHADNWFEMGKLKDSPFMLYTVPVVVEQRDIIPAITHVDGSCRVQTVSDASSGIYRLIQAFYELTEVPILLNTSFNLAGEPLVHTKEDALRTFKGSDLDFLFIVEDDKLHLK